MDDVDLAPWRTVSFAHSVFKRFAVSVSGEMCPNVNKVFRLFVAANYARYAVVVMTLRHSAKCNQES